MGSPMNGDIYEGSLRPGDIGLTEAEAKHFKRISIEERMAEFQNRFRAQNEAQAAASSGESRPMPRYKCHKEVWALKIAEIQPICTKPTIAELERLLNSNQESPAMTTQGDIIGGYIVVPADEGFAPFEISFEYMNKHRPEVGGYFVVYESRSNLPFFRTRQGSMPA